MKHRTTQQTTGETQSMQISKLPEIKLPTFNESYSEWSAIKELFTGLILKRTGLKDTAKLHYLQSSLTGAPLTLIEGFTLCDESLTPCNGDVQDRKISSHVGT